MQAPRRQQVRWVLWGLLLLETAVVVVAFRPWRASDTQDYLELASTIFDQGRYGYFRNGEFFPELLHPPGYPLLLVLFREVGRFPLGLIAVTQAALYLCGVFVVERLLARHELPVVPFLVAALFYPATAAYSVRILSEGPSVFVTAVLVFVVARPGAITPGRVVASGVLAGALGLLRPNLILLPLFVAAALVVIGVRPLGWRRATAGALGAIAAAAVVLLPYAIVNQRQVDEFTVLPPAAAVGFSAYAATFDGGYDFVRGRAAESESGREFEEDSRRVNAEIEERIAETEPEADLPEETRRSIIEARAFQGEALRRITEDPVGYGRHVISNLWRTWNSASLPTDTPFVARLATRVASAVIWVVGAAGGILLLVRRRWLVGERRNLIAVAIVLLYFPASQAGLQPDARYTAPGRLLLAAAAAMAVTALFRARGARWAADPGAASQP